jgi:hypothetical protein
VLKVPGLPNHSTYKTDSCTAADDLFASWSKAFCEKVEGWHSISEKQKPILDCMVTNLREKGCRP